VLFTGTRNGEKQVLRGVCGSQKGVGGYFKKINNKKNGKNI